MSDPTSDVVLFDYWRSSASYRVRIALNMLGVEYTSTPVSIPDGEHVSDEHLTRNPQGFVPVLDIDGIRLTQSLAIAEYLNETRNGNLLPADAAGRARVRALAYVIAMEIHPVCNPHLVDYVLEVSGGGATLRTQWMQHFIRKGLLAFERLLDNPATGSFCHGDTPGLADITLIPQLYNADRWNADYSDMPRIRAIAERALALPAFAAAHPDRSKPA